MESNIKANDAECSEYHVAHYLTEDNAAATEEKNSSLVLYCWANEQIWISGYVSTLQWGIESHCHWWEKSNM